MENVVSINHTKDNSIEFDLSTEGVGTDTMTVRMIIKMKGISLCFDAKKKAKKGDTWTVKIPPLSMVEKTVYNFSIEVQSDGYVFTPMEGLLNVNGDAKLFVGEVKNKTFGPSNKTEETTKQSKTTKVDKSSKDKQKKTTTSESSSVQTHPIAADASVDEIAKSLIDGVTPNKTTTKDERILAVLEEVGIKSKSKTKRPRISFIKSELFSSK